MRPRVLIAVMIAAVIASAVAGIWVLGSPAQARERRFDQMRIESLKSIASGINAYHTQTGGLPESLSHLDSEWVEPLDLRDPLTEEPYPYAASGPDRYELCAVFQQPSIETGTAWVHGAGRHCFRRQVRPRSY
jgi:type II secretory pathway pseudopilin PulG